MKVLIAGGGIGGLTAALCLAKDGHLVEVFEQAETFSEAGAGIQLSPNCTRVLHYLGLENDLLQTAFLPIATQIKQWNSGQLISENPLGDTVLKRYGFPYYHIHRGDLLKVLVNACLQISAITLHTDKKVSGFEQTAHGVTLHINEGRIDEGRINDEQITGDKIEGDVLVGADGIHSAIRNALWGGEKPNFTGNVAWRALVPTKSLPPGRISPTSTVWWGPNKHFVHYYVNGGEFVNCVCVVEKEVEKVGEKPGNEKGWQDESWTTQGDINELKHDFSNWHEDIQLLINNANPDSLFKWALYDREPMKKWGINRVTLLGDACHPTLPFMAQGAAMAIEDSAVLSSCLRGHVQNHTDIQQSLERYETLRRPRTANIQNGSRRNAAVFHMSGVKAWLRNRAAKQAGTRTLHNLFNYNALEQQP